MVSLTSCEQLSIGGKKTSDRFSSSPEKSPIQPGLIDEASGLVDSRTISGHLWVHEDGGSPAILSLINKSGALVSRITLPFENRDWEDLAVGPGPQDGTSYLYMADIGDNINQHDACFVYRFPEPKSPNEAVTSYDRIAFRYPDGPRDAEALLVDPKTKDIFVVTKREDNARLYRLPYPQSTSEITQAAYLGEIPLNMVTGGSVSADGNEILLRTYLGVQHWRRENGQSLADAMQRSNGRALVVHLEPQGEAIAFDKEGNGFYTLSERANAPSVTLNYYKRL